MDCVDKAKLDEYDGCLTFLELGVVEWEWRVDYIKSCLGNPKTTIMVGKMGLGLCAGTTAEKVVLPLTVA